MDDGVVVVVSDGSVKAIPDTTTSKSTGLTIRLIAPKVIVRDNSGTSMVGAVGTS